MLFFIILFYDFGIFEIINDATHVIKLFTNFVLYERGAGTEVYFDFGWQNTALTNGGGTITTTIGTGYKDIAIKSCNIRYWGSPPSELTYAISVVSYNSSTGVVTLNFTTENYVQGAIRQFQGEFLCF